ncbi:bifunctional DNA primase/polymerase (plasmid) [Streptomyces globisporus]|nr:bifunctional DNA primase/polymerase [Streptomyces globisporus]
MTDHQRAVALTWLVRGVAVVPCSRTDKGALVPGFGRDAPPEQLAKFSDPEQVRAWWSGRFKRAHVGLLTGRGTDDRGLVVVDLDMPKVDAQPLEGRWSGCHGGTDVLELLARGAGADWPDTYAVLTPSGGMHLYFAQPSAGPLIGCATGEGPTAPHIGPLVDVRGVGGYVIAAGSYPTAQGRVYERVSPPEMRPQPLPDWLLELLRPAAPPTTPPRRPAPVCLYARPAHRETTAPAATLCGGALLSGLKTL